ncbi:ATP-binding protein [Streptomyces albogriseolus]
MRPSASSGGSGGSSTDWGWARGGECLEGAELVVGELAANAVTHGRVSGRDFLLTLTLVRSAEGGFGALRIEVADSGGERPPTPTPEPCLDGEHGRGLLLVSAHRDPVGRRTPTALGEDHLGRAPESAGMRRRVSATRRMSPPAQRLRQVLVLWERGAGSPRKEASRNRGEAWG